MDSNADEAQYDATLVGDPDRIREQRHYRIPLSPGRTALITGPFPISEDEWKQMLAVLNAMKPGLIDARLHLPPRGRDDG